MSDTLTPFVYWAQTENQITLKVDLIDVKDLNVNVKEDTLKVMVYGYGAKGLNNYNFSLNLHSAIDPNESNYKIIDRQVDFVLKKKSNGWWPRLTSHPQKPSWLKIDFDKWKSEDMDDHEDKKRDICLDYPDMYDKLHKEELGYKKEDFAKVYLIIYNLCQFVGFIYVLAVTGIRYSRDGPDSMKETYMVVGNSLKLIQLLQFLEATSCNILQIWNRQGGQKGGSEKIKKLRKVQFEGTKVDDRISCIIAYCCELNKKVRNDVKTLSSVKHDISVLRQRIFVASSRRFYEGETHAEEEE